MWAAVQGHLPTPLSLIPLIMLLVPLSVVTTAIFFPWKSSSRNTLKHIFLQHHHYFQGGSVLQVAKGKTKWFLRPLLILWTNREKVLVVDCPWITCNAHKVNNTFKKLTHPFPTVSVLISSICLYTAASLGLKSSGNLGTAWKKVTGQKEDLGVGRMELLQPAMTHNAKSLSQVCVLICCSALFKRKSNWGCIAPVVLSNHCIYF